MKKRINGTYYNTDTAKKIAWAGADDNDDSFRFWSETLMQTKSGQYFIYGEGHARTLYGRKKEDGSIGWGEEIIPISAKQAQEYARKAKNNEIREEFLSQIF
jgi:hypothetical protein